MTEPEDSYRMTEKGWAIAATIWEAFVYQGEDINDLAASFGMGIDELCVLMVMAFQGGMISLD